MIKLKEVAVSSMTLMLCVLLVTACGSAKKTAQSKKILMHGKSIAKNETYASIQGNVARLRAMLCGKFTQYSTIADPDGKKHSVWLVNDGKDSVISYQLPAGDHHKVGYWTYQCQVLTSLLEEPLNVAFTQLIEINRDSIKEVYYQVPESFDYSITEILKNPKKAFEEINWDELEPLEGYNVFYYVRQSPLEYKGESILLKSKNAHSGKEFMSVYYEVNPQKVVMGRNEYDKDKKYLDKAKEEWLIKQAMIRPDWLD